MNVEYNHMTNLHTLEGPHAALARLLPDFTPASLLDVGCGMGTWLRAAIDHGITDIAGIDGVNIPRDQLLFPAQKFIHKDLSAPIDLGRRFALAICLEVGEHLPASAAGTLVKTLTKHSDTVLFSAACPGQPGQHHVNCQWPAFWQKYFNSNGFECDDSPRWKIWDEPNIEVWYRQNIFTARKNSNAGKETRIHAVVHPEMVPNIEAASLDAARQSAANTERLNIANGSMTLDWYIRTPLVALGRKTRRHLLRNGNT